MRPRTSTVLAMLLLFGACTVAWAATDLTGAVCPVSGQAVSEDATAAHKGGTVYFCCAKCPKAFAANPAKFATKANIQLVKTGQAGQQKCPLSGGPTKAATALAVSGVEVTFCCNKCRGKVDAAEGDTQLDMVFGAAPFAKAYVVAASE